MTRITCKSPIVRPRPEWVSAASLFHDNESEQPNMHDLNERQSRAVLAYLFDPGRCEVADLIDLHGARGALSHVLEPSHPAGLDRLAAIALADHDITRADDVHHLAENIERATIGAGGTLIIPGDAAWPRGLDDLNLRRSSGARWSAPWCLWAQAARSAPPEPGATVAFWGHRVASGFGTAFAHRGAERLVEDGYRVVCNGETGIASAAGQGAVQGGRAFAVVAGGIGRAYPRGNHVLLESITDCGAVYAPQPPGRTSTIWSIRYRDALLASLASCIAAVEVPLRAVNSTVFTTADALGKRIYSIAHTHLPHKQIGNWRLERDGATTVRSVQSLAELVAWDHPVPEPGHNTR